MPQTYEYWDDSENMFKQRDSQPSSVQPTGADSWQLTADSEPPSQSQPNPQPQAQPQPRPQQPQKPPRSEGGKQNGPDLRPADLPAQQQVAYVAIPQKRGRGWIVALVFVILLFIFAALCLKSCNDFLASSDSYAGISAGPQTDSVAVIDIDGTIQYDGTACSPEGLKTLLDRAERNASIKAVVLRVNSGGGTATAGEEMARYVRDFSKPIVVSSASINASAAYEISSQAKYIYVAKSTEIGAIGTAMQITDLSGLFGMLGISMDTITSADSKDSSYGYRPLTDDERAYYQHMVDQINDVFIANVAEGRGMSVDDVRKLANGLAYTGVDAVGNHLADEVGTLEDAMNKAAELAGVSSYEPYKLALANYDLSSLGGIFGEQKQSSQSALPALSQ